MSLAYGFSAAVNALQQSGIRPDTFARLEFQRRLRGCARSAGLVFAPVMDADNAQSTHGVLRDGFHLARGFWRFAAMEAEHSVLDGGAMSDGPLNVLVQSPDAFHLWQDGRMEREAPAGDPVRLAAVLREFVGFDDSVLSAWRQTHDSFSARVPEIAVAFLQQIRKRRLTERHLAAAYSDFRVRVSPANGNPEENRPEAMLIASLFLFALLPEAGVAEPDNPTRPDRPLAEPPAGFRSLLTPYAEEFRAFRQALDGACTRLDPKQSRARFVRTVCRRLLNRFPADCNLPADWQPSNKRILPSNGPAIVTQRPGGSLPLRADPKSPGSAGIFHTHYPGPRISCGGDAKLIRLWNGREMSHPTGRRFLHRPFVRCIVRASADDPTPGFEGFSSMFPSAEAEIENRVIALSLAGRKPFASLMSDCLPERLAIGGFGTVAWCFPLYIHGADGRRANVSAAALDAFQLRYPAEEITSEDVFHYLYGVMHHPEYGARNAIKPRGAFPGIPFEPEFRTYLHAGRTLGALHCNPAGLPEHPLHLIESESSRDPDWHVARLRLTHRRGRLQYNAAIALSEIPPAVFSNRIGGRSALEWIADQYRAGNHPQTRLTLDPNDPDDPDGVVRLIGQIVTMSLETLRVIAALPPMTGSRK